MEGKYQAYPEYINVDAQWMPNIPKHWLVLGLGKAVEFMRNGSSANQVEESKKTVLVSRIETISGGAINIHKMGHVDSRNISEHYRLEKGDIQFSNINSLSMVGNCAFFLGGAELYAGMNLLHIRPDSSRFYPKYMFYQFKTKWFRNRVEASAKPAINQASIPTGALRQFDFLCPSILEQQKIANFLDHETAKIDTLIEKQQQLIKLLKEKRQAVISHAVTKGLNPDVPMRDSGVEWLGEVPEHWVVKRVRHAFDIDNNLRTPIDRQSRVDMEGDYRYFGPTGVLNLINRYNVDGEYFLLGEDGDHFLKFKEKTMTIHVEGQFNVNNHAHLLRGKSGCSTKWGCLYFEHKDLFPWLIKQGVGRYKLQKTVLNDIPVVIPPESEQELILSEVNKKKLAFSKIESDAATLIKVLKERRTALISAAVTGKIDVRNWSAPDAHEP